MTWGYLLVGASLTLACAGAGKQSAESKLIPAGGSPDKERSAQSTDSQQPDTAASPEGEKESGSANTSRKARRNALMRRFDQHESKSAEVPRTCPGTESQEPSAKQASPKRSKPECYPDRKFVKRLCASTFPGVALVMFGKDSPWVRAYLKGPAKAWTTAPGAQDQERLAFREEVIMLESGEAQGEIAVSSGASFYALRWNGSCVKLTEEEVTKAAPWNKVTPPLQFKYFDDQQQAVLRENKRINATVSAMKKECRGSRMGSRSPKCEKLESRLTQLVAQYVRGGGQMPDPEYLP